MRIRPLMMLSAFAVATLALVAFLALTRLPVDAQLPVHWNAAGEPTRFAAAELALAMPVAVTAAVSLLFALLPRIEPLQDRMAGSAGLLETCWVGVLAMMMLVQAMIAAPAFGVSPAPSAMLAALGILLIAIGNALPRSRPGFFVGIRTPWALIDTDNWIATHRLGARTTIAAGVMILAAAILPVAGQTRAIVFWVALAVMVVPPVAYSWWHWRSRDTRPRP